MESDALWDLEPGVLDNPYPLYHRLRREHPVHWNERWGAWLVFGYDDVVATLRDPRYSLQVLPGFTSRVPLGAREAFRPVQESMSKWILFNDVPQHPRLRSLIGKAFTPERLRGLEGLIRRTANRLLDEARAERFDVMADFALPLPAGVVIEMLTGSVVDRGEVTTWAHDLATIMGKSLLCEADAVRAANSLNAMVQFFRSATAVRRDASQDDFISALLQAREDGLGLTEDEILHNCVALYVAGHETSTALIGNGILALLRERALRNRLASDPTCMGAFVEEVLRHDGPTQIITRLATEDVRLGGKTILQGQFVNLMLGSANRDPAQFGNPDAFDLDRKNVRSVAFGHGIHTCLGAMLARTEARLALRILLHRLPEFQQADVPPERHTTMGMRALKRLWILGSP